MNALSPAVSISMPLAPPDVVRLLKSSLDRIEDVPDYEERQAEVLTLIQSVRAQAAEPAVQRVLDLARAGVDDRDTVYGALQVARLAEHALTSGQFGTFPQAAALTSAIIDTLRYGPKESGARRLVGLLGEQCDDPAARRALDLCERFQERAGWGRSDRVSTAARHTLDALASGFDGSAEQVVDLGVDLCRNLYGPNAAGQDFEPVFATLSSVSDPVAGKAYRYLSDLAREMDGVDAGRFLLSKVSLAPMAFAVDADAERLRLASDAVAAFDDEESLTEASGRLLETIGNAMDEPGHRKVFALARSLERAVCSEEGDGQDGEESLPDLSGLVTTALEMARSSEVLDTDRQVLGAAERLLRSMGTSWSGHELKIMEWLKGSLTNKRARAAVSLVERISPAPGVPGPAWKALDLARRALDGEPLELIGWGREIIASMHPTHEARGYRELLGALREDPARADQARLLDLALSTLGTFGPSNAPSLVNTILGEIEGGAKDVDVDPLAMVRRMFDALPSAEERDSLIESSGETLLKQTGHPEAARFLALALELTHGSCDPQQSVVVFEKVLDKAEALRNGQPFRLIDDSLEVVNSVPDRLFQASALRKLMLKLAQEQIRQGLFSDALEKPLEMLSCLSETSSERLQRNVDLINLLLAAARDGSDTWEVLSRLYEDTPTAERDVMAASVFTGLFAPDSTQRNLARAREAGMTPGNWKVLGDTVRGADVAPGIFSLIRDGLEAMEAHSGSSDSQCFAGALSFVIGQEIEKRSSRQPEMQPVLDSLREAVQQGRYHERQEAVQQALLDAARVLLRQAPREQPASLETVQAQTAIMQMDHRWVDGDVKANRKNVLETFKALEGIAQGAHVTMDEWVLRSNDERPAPKVVEEGDYVVIGGLVLPKRKP